MKSHVILTESRFDLADLTGLALLIRLYAFSTNEMNYVLEIYLEHMVTSFYFFLKMDKSPCVLWARNGPHKWEGGWVVSKRARSVRVPAGDRDPREKAAGGGAVSRSRKVFASRLRELGGVSS